MWKKWTFLTATNSTNALASWPPIKSISLLDSDLLITNNSNPTIFIPVHVKTVANTSNLRF